MGLCAAELRASGPRVQCWARLQTGQHLPWHVMALLGSPGTPKGFGFAAKGSPAALHGRALGLPGPVSELLSFCPGGLGAGGREEGCVAWAPRMGRWDGAGMQPDLPPTLQGVSPAPWGLVLRGPGAVVEGAPGKEWTLGLLCLTPCPPGVVSWGCALLHTPCAAGAGGCALRPWQCGGTLQQ